ncbi:MAG TPA: response regulator [Vicinamibacteria bacterium]|nr:response regulator [Vicinamibacteria bacterium]
MSKKILLADDSITIQKVIELTFSDEDFDVITVGNGRLALEKLPEVRPDIVLCDIIMPEKDGYQVCEQIKASPATAHVPVLLLTGAFEPFDQERAARAGYDGSLAKPFEPETLIAKVKDLLARAPARAAAPPPAPVVRPAARPPAARPPAAAAPPPVLPFPRPAPPPTPPPKASFIPDEPFGHLEEPEAAGAAGPTLAPITEDESATLLSPPAPEPAPGDSTSTVMFHAGDLPWSTPPPPAPTPAHAPAAPAPPSTAAPEPVFLPEDSAEVVEEPAVFEEVLEEDLDFGETSLEPPGADTRTVLFTPGVTLPPILPAEGGGLTGAFEAVKGGAVHEPQAAPAFEPEPVYEPEPEPFYEPEPMPAFEPESVIAEATAAAAEPERLLEEEASPGPGPAPLAEPEPSPAFEPQPFEPEPAPPAAAPESFADVAPAAPSPEPSPVAASEAAHVAVPVEMVEKIAQRVVAQISEKAVREIAWEVIPDLAEALIKREIERLKAELQKT